MKRTLALFLTMIVMVFMLPTAVFAAAGTSEAVLAKGAALSEKYGVVIKHPMAANGEAAIAINSLEILDMALETVTPSVVRQTSAFFEEYMGRKLAFEFRQSGDLAAENVMVSLGGFNTEEARIVLYLPSRAGTAVIAGDNPVTIVHEFGHALHFMMQVLYGADRLRAEWLLFNGGIDYNPAYIEASPDEQIFVTGYAATLYEEDFAEVIGNSFIRSNAGQGFSSQLSENGESTGLGRKYAYAGALLAEFFPNDAEMLANFKKTLSAPTALEYQGMRLSGLYLQFIGFPQPKYILDGTLNLLGTSREQAVWIRSIGGWYVLEPGGNELIVFPGLNVVDAPAGFIPPG